MTVKQHHVFKTIQTGKTHHNDNNTKILIFVYAMFNLILPTFPPQKCLTLFMFPQHFGIQHTVFDQKTQNK